jgi:hypothetical protein
VLASAPLSIHHLTAVVEAVSNKVDLFLSSLTA